MNIVVASHGKLCEGLVDALHMMVAEPAPIVAVGLDEHGIDDFRDRLAAAVDASLAKGKTLIMSDLIGGTPYNEAYALFLQHPEELRVVAGANFPMLIEVGIAAADSDDLDEVLGVALEAGRGGVVAAELPDEGYESDEDDLF